MQLTKSGEYAIRGDALFFVELEKKKLFTTSIPIKIGVYSNNKLIEEIKTNFMGPQKAAKPK